MPVETRPILAGPDDPIRVVPLSLPDELRAPPPQVPAPAPARLTYRGGSLLTAVQVYTIFWGAPWQAAQAGLAGNLNQFFDFVLTSQLIDQMAEYNVPGKPIGHGSRLGTITVVSPVPHRTMSDAGLRHFLQQEISANPSVPQPTPNTLYFIYLPPCVTLSQGGGRSCLTFCGYHDHINGQIFYAARPFPGCSGCTGGLQTLDALTSTSSHELCEAITDPVPGQGWYDDANSEIGDIWRTRQLGAYTLQLEWSNAANACR